MLQSIQQTGWQSIEPATLSCNLPRSDAAPAEARRSVLASARNCFERIFGDWAEREILPALNSALVAATGTVADAQKKRYTPTNRTELMNYFLEYSVSQLLEHKKHGISSFELESARAGLIGKARAKAIHSCLNFTDHKLEAVIHTWPQHVLQFIQLGTVYTLDETIVPFFGKKADDEGKLRHCPNKPHDFGMWVWVLAQRLQWSGLPLTIGLLPAFFAPSQSPEVGAVHLIRAVRACIEGPAQPLLMVADSLWCSGSTIAAMQPENVRVLISVKLNNGLIPDSLLNLASSDLPDKSTRTYHKSPYLLQMRGSANNRLFGLVTTAWSVPGDVPLPPRLCAWETALAFATYETSESLAKLCKLSPEDAAMDLDPLIYKITGWDVLRQQDQQDSRNPPTYEQAKKWPAKVVSRFYWKKTNKQPRARMSKAAMLAELFPESAPADDIVIEDEEPAPQRKRTRDKVQDLRALRETVRYLPLSIVVSLIPLCSHRSVVQR